MMLQTNTVRYDVIRVDYDDFQTLEGLLLSLGPDRHPSCLVFSVLLTLSVLLCTPTCSHDFFLARRHLLITNTFVVQSVARNSS